MSRLIIRNVGPIESLDINLNRVNVFIGAQGSGKSTIAKIVSFCSWLEKVNDATDRAVTEGLIARLGKFHHMSEYFSSKSVLFYEGENVAFAYNWKGKSGIPLSRKVDAVSPEHLDKDELIFYSQKKIINPKVTYIPAERNFVSAVSGLKDFSANNDNLQSFLNDWFDAKRHYTKEGPLAIMKLGIDYFYNNGADIDYLALAGNRTIPLTSASSGFQSVVPLVVMLRWLSSGIYEENRPFSPAENERVRNIISNLSDSANENELELLDRLRGFIQGRVYTHTQFIVEEPEQNLFPRTQMDLLYHLLDSINHGKNHRLTLTTHSPYVLYALNNCLLAHLTKDCIAKDVASSIGCLEYAFNPSDVSVWSIRDGYLCNEWGDRNMTIQDERGLIRRNYFNDVMKEVMGDFNLLLQFLD